MKFSLYNYLFAILLFFFLFFFSRDETTGLIYLAFFLFCVTTINLFKSDFFKGAYFSILFAVIAGYFVRPMILVDHPDLFMYQKIASRTDIDMINKSLGYALMSTVCIAIGFILTIKFTSDKIVPPSKMNNFMMDRFFVINTIIFFLIAIQVVLILTTGAGVKTDTERDSTYAFILKLLSPDVSFVVSYLYFTKYWGRLNLQQRAFIILLLLLTSFSLFVTGSKAFLGMFALCFFYEFVFRNKKIKLSYFTIACVFGFFVLAFSFIMAAAVSFSNSKDLRSIMHTAESFASTKNVLLISNDITKRMMGLDGQIAAYIISDQQNKNPKYIIEEAFTAKEITLHTLNNIFPKVTFTNAPGSGKVISENIVGLPEDVLHAGSLGLFASVFFMSGPYFILFNIILGVILAFYFIYTRRIKNDDLRFILFFMGCFFVLRIILSGNFDTVLGDFIPKLILLFIYIKLTEGIGKVRYSQAITRNY